MGLSSTSSNRWGILTCSPKVLEVMTAFSGHIGVPLLLVSDERRQNPADQNAHYSDCKNLDYVDRFAAVLKAA